MIWHLIGVDETVFGLQYGQNEVGKQNDGPLPGVYLVHVVDMCIRA